MSYPAFLNNATYLYLPTKNAISTTILTTYEADSLHIPMRRTRRILSQPNYQPHGMHFFIYHINQQLVCDVLLLALAHRHCYNIIHHNSLNAKEQQRISRSKLAKSE